MNFREHLRQNLPSTVERIHPRSLKTLHTHLQHLVAGRLWLKVLLAMALGLGVGMLLGPAAGLVPPRIAVVAGEWLAFPGQIFLGLVQMIVVPLVFASIIRGLAASENLEQLRKLGLRTVGYFVATTVVAIIIGLVVALAVQPGTRMGAPAMRASVAGSDLDPAFITEAPAGPAHAAAPDDAPAAPSASDAFAVEELPDRIVGFLPVNPLGALTEGQMLQVIVFAFILGMALLSMPIEQAKPLLTLLGSLQEACMVIVKWAMRLAPLAVFGLMARLASQIGLRALAGMGIYVLTVLLGLAVLVVLYFLILFVVARMRPLRFISAVREVVLLAFSTSSSAAVMPLSIKTADERLGVRPTISQFVIPLGATINMNGTALYQGVATVFLAQVFGVDLTTGSLLLVIVTAVGASIGSPATPGVGIVILSMVITSAGIPAGGVALIMGVDRILDMSRTAVNVMGDLVTTVVMDRWVGGERTAPEQRIEQAVRDEIRKKTGEDIIVNHHPPISAGIPAEGAKKATAAIPSADPSIPAKTAAEAPATAPVEK